VLLHQRGTARLYTENLYAKMQLSRGSCAALTYILGNALTLVYIPRSHSLTLSRPAQPEQVRRLVLLESLGVGPGIMPQIRNRLVCNTVTRGVAGGIRCPQALVLAEDGLVKTAALRAALAPRAFFQAFAVSKTVRLALFALCWGLAACAGMAAADVADVLSGGKDREVDAAASTAATPKTRQLLAAVCETRRFVASVLSFPCALLLSAQVRRGSCAELLLIKEGGHHVHVTKAESVLEILKPWLFCTASQEGLAERFQRHCVNHNSTMEIFQGMSDVSRMACFEHMKLQSYRAGQVIVKKGDLGNVVYFVEKGEALATDGKRALRLFQAGSFFGEIAFTACARSAFGRDGGVPHKTLRESLFTGGSGLPRRRWFVGGSRLSRQVAKERERERERERESARERERERKRERETFIDNQ